MIYRVDELPSTIASLAGRRSGGEMGWEIDYGTEWWDGEMIYRADHDWLHVTVLPEKAIAKYRPIYGKGGAEWYGSWVEVYSGLVAVATP